MSIGNGIKSSGQTRGGTGRVGGWVAMDGPTKLADLLGKPESEWLDFKAEFHATTVELVHDILCLANARAATDRYLVFGVDNTGNVIGVEKAANKLVSNNLQDLLRASNFNRIPSVRLEDFKHGGHTVSVLTVANAAEKPFFLLKDKSEGKQRLRNGAIYTRIGDTNVPMTESAPEAMVEQMWRERFGIDLTPLERMGGLLRERDSWETQVDGERTILHHRTFPEFTVADGEVLVAEFQEDWATRFPNPQASSFHVELRHNATVLKRVLFVHCDGYRYRLPAPERAPEGGWVIDRDGLGYLVARLYDQYWDIDETLTRLGVQLIGGG